MRKIPEGWTLQILREEKPNVASVPIRKQHVQESTNLTISQGETTDADHGYLVTNLAIYPPLLMSFWSMVSVEDEIHCHNHFFDIFLCHIRLTSLTDFGAPIH